MLSPMFTSDARIVRTVLAGHSEPFGTLVTRYLAAVHAVAYARTHNHADAEDVAQETFLTAFRSLDSLREPKRFKAWLIGIARNSTAAWLETHRRERALAEKVTEARTVDRSDMEQRELQAILWREVSALDETSQDALVLFYQAGHTTKEIAALTNASHDAVRKRLQRAREHLGARLLDKLLSRCDILCSWRPATRTKWNVEGNYHAQRQSPCVHYCRSLVVVRDGMRSDSRTIQSQSGNKLSFRTW